MTGPESAPELSVVVTIYDEEETLAAVLEELLATLPESPSYEIVVVDDGSRDETPAILARFAKDHASVRTTTHARNRGKSAALVTGALAARGSWLATMDGDGQNDPRDLLRLLDEARRLDPKGRPIVVCGLRCRRRDTVVKRISSRVANRIRSLLLRDETPDTGCGLKVIRRNDFLALPRFDNMHRFLPALVLREGGTTRSMPVNDRPRSGGRSKYGLTNRLLIGIADLFGVFWLLRRSLPPEGEDEQ